MEFFLVALDYTLYRILPSRLFLLDFELSHKGLLFPKRILIFQFFRPKGPLIDESGQNQFGKLFFEITLEADSAEEVC